MQNLPGSKISQNGGDEDNCEVTRLSSKAGEVSFVEEDTEDEGDIEIYQQEESRERYFILCLIFLLITVMFLLLESTPSQTNFVQPIEEEKFSSVVGLSNGEKELKAKKSHVKSLETTKI